MYHHPSNNYSSDQQHCYPQAKMQHRETMMDLNTTEPRLRSDDLEPLDFMSTTFSSMDLQVTMPYLETMMDSKTTEPSLHSDGLEPLHFTSTTLSSMDLKSVQNGISLESATSNYSSSTRVSQTIASSPDKSTTKPLPIQDPVDVSIIQQCAIEIEDSTRWSIRSSQSLLDPSEIQRVFDPPCTPTQFDVLCGRGGIPNHEGNQAYLKEKERMQEEYKKVSDKQKFQMSLQLAAFVKNRGGRFLMKEKGSDDLWYEIDESEARKKCSQALRDQNTSQLKREHRAKTNFGGSSALHQRNSTLGSDSIWYASASNETHGFGRQVYHQV